MSLFALPAMAAGQAGGASDAVTPEDLEAYGAAVSCPSLDGLEVASTVFGHEQSVTVACSYRADGSTATVRVVFDEFGSPSPRSCGLDAFDDLDPASPSVQGRVLSTAASTAGEYQYDRGEFDSRRAEFEAAAANLVAQALPFAAPCPPASIECSPIVGGMPVTFDTTAILNVWDGAFNYNCWWSPSGPGSSDLVIDVVLATEGQNSGMLTTICSTESGYEAGIGFEASTTNAAVFARYSFRSPAERFDLAAGREEARRLVDLLAPNARSCEGLEIIPRSSYFTPIPPWMSDALAPGIAVGPAPMELALDGSGEATGRAAEPVPSTQPSVTGRSGWMSAAGVAALLLSLVGIGLALRLSRREARVRPGIEIVRIAAMAGVAGATAVAFSRPTSPWAIAGGIGIGLPLGFWQGRNLSVRLTDHGTFVRRSATALVAFAASLVVSQVFAHLGRSGMATIGVGLTVLSAATAAGLMLGRRGLLRDARAAAGGTGVALVMAVAMAAVAAAPTFAQEADPTAAAAEYLRGLVNWDTVDLLGGVGATLGKPPIAFTVSEGFKEPPPPVSQELAWEFTPPDGFGSPQSFALADTYSFALTEAGTCCSVTYEVEGTITTKVGEGQAVEEIRGSARLSPIGPVGVKGESVTGAPFTKGVVLPDGRCTRDVTQESSVGEGAWTTYVVNGEDQEYPPYPNPAALQIGCEVEGFDVDTALSFAPSSPPAGDPSRYVGHFGEPTGGCPTYQETFAAVYDPVWNGQADTDHLAALFLDPNGSACSGVIHVGDEKLGGTRIELDWELASIDPAAEGRRLFNVHDEELRAVALHEIPEEVRCDIDNDGIPVNPPGQAACQHRSWHRVDDGRVTIWTDTDTLDGPNVIIVGTFDWGHYRARCHHCLPGDERIAATIKRWHELGARGAGNHGPGAPVEEIGEAPGSREEALRGLADALGGDEAGEALAAAIIGLIGSTVIAGSAVVDAGGVDEALERLRRREPAAGTPSDPPPEAGSEAPDPDAEPDPPPSGEDPDSGGWGSADSQIDTFLDTVDESRKRGTLPGWTPDPVDDPDVETSGGEGDPVGLEESSGDADVVPEADQSKPEPLVDEGAEDSGDEDSATEEEDPPLGDDEPQEGAIEADPTTPDVRLGDDEIEAMVRWGIDTNRSPQDIQEDLDALNTARGGSGPVELPVPLEQIETPDGPVTMTADQAEVYRDAVSEAEVLQLQKDTLRREIGRLQQEAARWGGAERLSAERFAAGMYDMLERAQELESRTAALEAEIRRLNRRPDAMTWDAVGTGLTSGEADVSWEARLEGGWHHDELARLEQELAAARSEFTEHVARYGTADEQRLAALRQHLDAIEGGTSPPIQEDFADHPDPDAALFDALEDWRTRDTSGPYFDEAARLRAEIAARESGLHVDDVEAAATGDRGTVFDRPARELQRIDEEREQLLESFRQLDARQEELTALIADVEGRAGG